MSVKIIEDIAKEFKSDDSQENRRIILEKIDDFASKQNPKVKSFILKFKEVLIKYKDIMDEFVFLYIRKPSFLNKLVYSINPWEESIEERKKKFTKEVSIKIALAFAAAGGTLVAAKMLSNKKKK